MLRGSPTFRTIRSRVFLIFKKSKLTISDALKVSLPSFMLYNLAGVLARPCESRVSSREAYIALRILPIISLMKTSSILFFSQYSTAFNVFIGEIF